MKDDLLIRNLRDPATRNRAFEELVRRFQQPLYWQIRRMVFDHDDADDLLQNAFVRAWKSVENFRGDSSLKTWLYRIAINETLTFIAQKKKRPLADLDNIEDHLAHSESSVSALTGEDIQQKLQQAVETLPEKQRIVFNMKYFDEMKYEEIAEILGGTVGSLKASFHHAVKKVEEFLTKD